ncbi:MAG TPA: GTPase domain-containing protein [Verrucomicrobiales bacterium]|nr:GTPase domain-containing protein [Verrucomicrobiales bacterium]
MAVVNHDTKEVSFKLVYCGTPMGGKTTNLNYIHSRIDGSQRGDLVSLATSSDRTLFFDFLPIQTVVINGYKTRFMLYTVPGQVNYNATRQMVLKGVDGIIFVADSLVDRMEENLTAWKSMERNLQDNQTPLSQLPLVLQFNKRDLPGIAPVQYMEYLLNNGPHRFPFYEAAASTGVNVFATLNALAQEILQRFHRAGRPATGTTAPQPPPARARV